jgi:hypothetical protein
MAFLLDAIALPDLIWVDEFDWTPVEQSVATTLTGAIIVESAARQAGRLITLEGAAEYGWASRSLVKSLYAKAQTPALQMTLTIDDARSFTVIFNHAGNPIEAKQIVGYRNPGDTDYYQLTLRLMEI